MVMTAIGLLVLYHLDRATTTINHKKGVVEDIPLRHDATGAGVGGGGGGTPCVLGIGPTAAAARTLCIAHALDIIAAMHLPLFLDDPFGSNSTITFDVNIAMSHLQRCSLSMKHNDNHGDSPRNGC